MPFPLECLDKASLKQLVHMLKDMLKLAKKEIINLWISFVFVKTPSSIFGYHLHQFGLVLLLYCNEEAYFQDKAKAKWQHTLINMFYNYTL